MKNPAHDLVEEHKSWQSLTEYLWSSYRAILSDFQLSQPPVQALTQIGMTTKDKLAKTQLP